MNPSWEAVLVAADAVAGDCGWLRDASGPRTQGRYLKELTDGFAAVVHVQPGEGSTISPDGELTVGESVDILVGATYLPGERLLAGAGYRVAGEISDPAWDIDSHALSPQRLVGAGLTAAVNDAMVTAMVTAEQFSTAQASPAAFVSALELELEDEWTEPQDFVAIPAVLAAAGLHDQARVAMDRARLQVGQAVPDSFWTGLQTVIDAAPPS